MSVLELTKKFAKAIAQRNVYVCYCTVLQEHEKNLILFLVQYMLLVCSKYLFICHSGLFMYTLEGVSNVANFIKPGLPLSICNVFFVSKGNIHVLIFYPSNQN